MAERAVLACQTAHGQYDLYGSRWGGTDAALRAVCGGTSPANLPGVHWEYRRTATSFSDVVADLDYLSTGILYRVRGTNTAVFLPLWFGLPFAAARPSPGVGGLVAVASLPDARSLRDWFRTLKGSLADALGAGELPAPVTPFLLLGAIATLDGREWYFYA